MGNASVNGAMLYPHKSYASTCVRLAQKLHLHSPKLQMFTLIPPMIMVQNGSSSPRTNGFDRFRSIPTIEIAILSHTLTRKITSPSCWCRAALFLETCGADGLLGCPELAELLCRDVQAEVPAAARPAATDAADAAAASGPSAFVAHEATWG